MSLGLCLGAFWCPFENTVNITDSFWDLMLGITTHHSPSVQVFPLVSGKEKRWWWGNRWGNRLFYHLFVLCLPVSVAGFAQLSICSKGQLLLAHRNVPLAPDALMFCSVTWHSSSSSLFVLIWFLGDLLSIDLTSFLLKENLRALYNCAVIMEYPQYLINTAGKYIFVLQSK